MTDTEHKARTEILAEREKKAHWRTEKKAKNKRDVRGEWIAMIEATDFLDIFPKADLSKLSDLYRTGGYRAVTLDPMGIERPVAARAMPYAAITRPLIIFSRNGQYGRITYTVALRFSSVPAEAIEASVSCTPNEGQAAMSGAIRQFGAKLEQRINNLSIRLAEPGDNTKLMAELQLLWKLKLGLPL